MNVAECDAEAAARGGWAGAARETHLRIGRVVSRRLGEAQVARAGRESIVEPISDDVGPFTRVVEDAHKPVAMSGVRSTAAGSARANQLHRAGEPNCAASAGTGVGCAAATTRADIRPIAAARRAGVRPGSVEVDRSAARSAIAASGGWVGRCADGAGRGPAAAP